MSKKGESYISLGFCIMFTASIRHKIWPIEVCLTKSFWPIKNCNTSRIWRVMRVIQVLENCSKNNKFQFFIWHRIWQRKTNAKGRERGRVTTQKTPQQRFLHVSTIKPLSAVRQHQLALWVWKDRYKQVGECQQRVAAQDPCSFFPWVIVIFYIIKGY